MIDEIQKVPELLNIVHILIEEKLGYQFIMTGSERQKTKKTRGQSPGWKSFSQTDATLFCCGTWNCILISQGNYILECCLLSSIPNPEEVLRAYAGIYLKEEVQAEGTVRNVGDFARFLETMSFSHGFGLLMLQIFLENVKLRVKQWIAIC